MLPHTVYHAIQALELVGVLTWVNRIVRERVRERDLFGQWVSRWRVLRTSNAYAFRDPNPAAGHPSGFQVGKSAGTRNQTSSIVNAPSDRRTGRRRNQPLAVASITGRSHRATHHRQHAVIRSLPRARGRIAGQCILRLHASARLMARWRRTLTRRAGIKEERRS